VVWVEGGGVKKRKKGRGVVLVKKGVCGV